MPQWLSNLASSDSRWSLIALVVGVVVVLALLYAVLRLGFGHRLRVPAGGRSRQPRLGVVDAFSLDGQRQLVLIRRDNVEHLLMIGGPNDVVIEPSILRSAAVSAPSPRERAAESKAPPLPAGAVAQVPAAAAPVPLAPQRPAKPTAAPETAAPTEASVARLPDAVLKRADANAVLPVAPRPPVAKPAPVRTEAPAPSVPAISPPARPAPGPFARPAPVARSPLPAPITPMGPRPRPASTPQPAPATNASPPPAEPESPSAAPVIPSPSEIAGASEPPVDKEGQPASPAKAQDAFSNLESLEAEMARLLGRDR